MVDVRCSVHGKWWSVSQRSELLVDEVGRDIVRLALPFVARIATRRAFVETWHTTGNEPLGLTPRGDLVVAAILTRLGDHAAAKKMLAAGLEAAAGQRYAAFYAEVVGKLQAQG